MTGDTRVSMALDSGNRRSVIGGVDTPGEAHDLLISGNTAYLADGESGLQIIDISNPENPQTFSSADTPGKANRLIISGTNVFIADGPRGIQVVDISTPDNPFIIGNGVGTPDDAMALAIVGNRAYVAYGSDENEPDPSAYGGLLVVDISNPSNLNIIGTLDLGYRAFGVVVKDSFAYVTGRPRGKLKDGRLFVVDITDISEMDVVGSVSMPNLLGL